MSTMDEAYRRDYADKRRIDELRSTIQDFLDDPPSRCPPGTRAGLETMVRRLRDDANHIVAVWD